MENSIIIPDNRFNFNDITLVEPVSLQGGTYFTKLYNASNNVYVQTPKGTTKQGFVKSSKKIHNDLVFEKNSDEFIQWLANLESKCIDLIYQNSSDWFQQPLELVDIESAFNTIVKVSKSSGYTIRSSVKIHTMTKEPVIKVYNQSETILSMNDVVKDTNILTILEIQGVRFTSKSFQLDTEIRQVMVLDKDIFDTCLIKPVVEKRSPLPSLGQTMNVIKTEEDTSITEASATDTSHLNGVYDDTTSGKNENDDHENVIHLENISAIEANEYDDKPDRLTDNTIDEYEEDDFEDDSDVSDEENMDPPPKLTFGEETSLTNIETIHLGKTDNTSVDELDIDPSISLEIEEPEDIGNMDNTAPLENHADTLPESSIETEKMEDSDLLVNSILDDVVDRDKDTSDLHEVTDALLSIEDDPVQLNSPDEHYYELFEKVRSEAKEAKKRAKEAYLKAKNIKKSYMLETMSDSSEDSIDSSTDIDELDQSVEINLDS